MVKIICLANSWKLKERCIAGIDIDTKKWVRPVCDSIYNDDGRIPKNIRLIDGREPALLDILEINIDETGNDFGFECENRSILSGKWVCSGQIEAVDLIQYYVNFPEILHNSWKYVNPSYLQSLSFQERRTLQLVYVINFSVEKKTTSKGDIEWRGTIEAANGQKLSGAKITDPMFIDKLEAGHKPENNCLITVSLGIPWAPPNWEGEIPCWKLIAGVIELCSLDLILFEMKRLGWSRENGVLYLQQTYNKKTRKELTTIEVQEFLNHLKSLP